MKLSAAILIPSQSAESARWWAVRWYRRASLAERAAMLQVLEECGLHADLADAQDALPLFASPPEKTQNDKGNGRVGRK